MTWYYRNIILQRINSVVVLCCRIVLLLQCWWTELRTMLRHLNRRDLNGITWVLLTVYNLQCIIRFSLTLMLSSVVCQNNGQFQVWELNIWQFINCYCWIYIFLNLNEYHFPIFILSIHFRQISFFKITKDIQSNNNNNIVLSMLYAEICPKVRSIIHSPLSRALCLLSLGHILAYNMDNTILLYEQKHRKKRQHWLDLGDVSTMWYFLFSFDYFSIIVQVK